MSLYNGPMGTPPQNDSWEPQRWELKLCWTPQKCFLSGKLLWGKYAYCGENWITGPGKPVPERYWIAKDEFIIWQLKKG